ncbi:MAG: DinB family protein [FCB group bacterium]|nr:DinB family protein [FCB group bacterium]
MKKKHELKLPRGYDMRTQRKVGLFAAQLDDQLKRLRNNIKGLTVKQLEWQQRRGMNTIGMLLAHLALVEVWWIKVAPAGIPWEPEGKKVIQKVCGIEDDGLPIPPDGQHPKYLRGFSLIKYLTMLTKARRSIHREMKTWYDRDLEKLYKLNTMSFTRMWTLYHVLEHFSAHFGQIQLMKHMMRDADVLVDKKK